MVSTSPRRSTRAAATRRKAPVVEDAEGEENQTPHIKKEEDERLSPVSDIPKKRGRPKKVLEEQTTTKLPTRRRTRAEASEESAGLFSPSAESVEATLAKKEPARRRTLGKTSRRSRISSAGTFKDEGSQLLTPEPSQSPEPASVLVKKGTAPTLALESILEPESELVPEPESETVPEPDFEPTKEDDSITITESVSEPAPHLDEVPQSIIEPSLPTEEDPGNAVSDQTVIHEPGPESQTFEKVNAQHTQLERPMDIVVRKRNAGITLSQGAVTSKRRTVITWLILKNFKSYAGRQEVGPFHASFSSVVGPNGSGKSNVIDSLLFVFGFRASKMRQGKISALIHNSAAFPDLDHCEVEVHFQEVKDLPEGGSQVIPESQLVISRKAFKNNSSKYYINNRESNFTAVTDLLKGRGVDLDHKRFLILQGEVESIAQMKPKAATEHDDGLLEYLEDIIGTSKYKTPIEESVTETENLNEVCMEKNSRVQHVEKEKGGLEDKKNKALAFIRDENELATKQSALYQIYMSNFDDHISVAQETVAQLQGQLDGELQKHQGNEEEIKGLEKVFKTGSKESEKYEKQASELQKEVAKIDNEVVKFEEKKKFLAGKQKKLEKTKETSKYGISEAETLAKQYKADVERCQDKIRELELNMMTEEKELEVIRSNLAGKTQGLSDEIAAKQQSLEPWNAKINERQSAMAIAQSELDILHERENSGAKMITELEAKISGFEESKQAKVNELEQCKRELKRVTEESQKTHSQLKDLTCKEPSIRAKLSGARQKADEARATLSATQTQGNVLTGLLRLKESGRISGFHGRLGNLGAIDQKFDVAISTACPQLDNLVVDSVEVGQQCINYLRKNNLGRANFILLDRLPQRDMSQINTPEDVPRLFDLVNSKDQIFNPAFYSVLQNTLVANDLEQANRIAYGAKRWRVVTLNGQLIDKSGTMSGGGTRVAKGGMSSKITADVSKDQVIRYEQERDSLEQTFTEFQQEQRHLEMLLKDLESQLPSLETRVQKIALEMDSFDRNINDSTRRIKELSAEQATSQHDNSRTSGLKESIASMEKEVSKLHAETSDMETEIKVLQDKIMEIGGVKLRSQKAKVDGLKQQIDTLTDTASNAEISRSKEEKQRVKHEKTYADAIKDLEKLALDAAKLEVEIASQATDVAGLRQQAEDAQEASEIRKEEIQAVKKELDERMAELNKTRAIEIEMRIKLEEGQKVLAEHEKKRRFYEDKLSKLSYQSTSDLIAEEEAEGLPTYTKDEIQDMDRNVLKDEIEELEKRNESVTVDLSVLAEYRKRVEEHATRSLDLADAVSARDAAKQRCDELRRLRLEGFMEGFSIITARLKEMYQMITMGGNAELELVDSLDPFSEGILFSVMPPKKSWKNISNLSGGEKTLSSLALVFALHHYKPTPLYVMDEIDAALDFRNVSIVASYIQQRTKNAQFIVISLRNNMFELASRLVGVYKVNHMTKSVTIENKDYLSTRA